MGAEQAIFVRRDDRVAMELDGATITDVSVADHLQLVIRAAAVLGMAVVPMFATASPPKPNNVELVRRQVSFDYYGDLVLAVVNDHTFGITPNLLFPAAREATKLCVKIIDPRNMVGIGKKRKH